MDSDGGKVEEIKVNPSLTTSSGKGAVAGVGGTEIEMETETDMETEIAHRDKQEFSDSSISKNENDDISGERQTGQLTQPVTDPIDDDNSNANADADANANVSTQISNPVTDVGYTNNPTKPPHEQEAQAQETQEAKQERVLPNKEKYKILLVGVGSAPMLKKSKFLLPGKEPFLTLHSRLKKMLKIPPSSHLYLYVNQAFIPSHEDLIGDLGDLFSVGDELQIHYSLQEAFS